jgi:hypothetical protein
MICCWLAGIFQPDDVDVATAINDSRGIGRADGRGGDDLGRRPRLTSLWEEECPNQYKQH